MQKVKLSASLLAATCNVAAARGDLALWGAAGRPSSPTTTQVHKQSKAHDITKSRSVPAFLPPYGNPSQGEQVDGPQTGLLTKMNNNKFHDATTLSMDNLNNPSSGVKRSASFVTPGRGDGVAVDLLKATVPADIMLVASQKSAPPMTCDVDKDCVWFRLGALDARKRMPVFASEVEHALNLKRTNLLRKKPPTPNYGALVYHLMKIHSVGLRPKKNEEAARPPTTRYADVDVVFKKGEPDYIRWKKGQYKLSSSLKSEILKITTDKERKGTKELRVFLTEVGADGGATDPALFPATTFQGDRRGSHCSSNGTGLGSKTLVERSGSNRSNRGVENVGSGKPETPVQFPANGVGKATSFLWGEVGQKVTVRNAAGDSSSMKSVSTTNSVGNPEGDPAVSTTNPVLLDSMEKSESTQNPNFLNSYKGQNFPSKNSVLRLSTGSTGTTAVQDPVSVSEKSVPRLSTGNLGSTAVEDPVSGSNNFGSRNSVSENSVSEFSTGNLGSTAVGSRNSVPEKGGSMKSESSGFGSLSRNSNVSKNSVSGKSVSSISVKGNFKVRLRNRLRSIFRLKKGNSIKRRKSNSASVGSIKRRKSKSASVGSKRASVGTGSKKRSKNQGGSIKNDKRAQGQRGSIKEDTPSMMEKDTCSTGLRGSIQNDQHRQHCFLRCIIPCCY